MTNQLASNKFIVITRSRTGSNLLISLLNSHPSITAYKEVFGKLENRSTQKLWDDTFSIQNKKIKF